jgi:transposase-like protein
MHCSNYTRCGREIGLVVYKLSSLGNLRFHSADCLEDWKRERDKRLQEEARKRHFLDWLRRPPPGP